MSTHIVLLRIENVANIVYYISVNLPNHKRTQFVKELLLKLSNLLSKVAV